MRCVVDTNEVGPGVLAAVLRGEFCLNGETYALGRDVDWRNNPSKDREWLIQLNKFYFAPALTSQYAATGDQCYLRRWMELTQSWIDQGIEPGFIAADVTGRRLQNWCMAFHGALMAPNAPALPQQFVQTLQHSVQIQAQWLRENLHDSRNHRTLELFALLLCATAFPSLAAAAQWREFARLELSRNALADFRPDGGHCEQSSHYHCIALRNHLMALQVLRDHGEDHDPVCLERLQRAAHFAARMHMPDGAIAAFSDADRGSYTQALQLAALLFRDATLRYMATGGQEGVAPTSGSILFPDSGYAVLRSDWRERPAHDRAPMQLVVDCGPIGDGNHGHFDLLSIEAHANGLPVVIDPGRYTYDESGDVNWRAAFRSTAAHSTIEVDGLNQVRYESGPRRMKVRGPHPGHHVLAFHAAQTFAYLHARATGAVYDAAHDRRIVQVHGKLWVIVDDVASKALHTYRSRFQLPTHCQGKVQVVSQSRFSKASCEFFEIHVYSDVAHVMKVEAAWVSPRYGERVAAPRLCIELEGRDANVVTIIVPRDATATPAASAGVAE